MSKPILKGITWGHSRGITPLLAFSQRFGELHGTEVTWQKRTLQEFADFPIERLVEKYDLLIIDHPWVGCAAALECVLPLDKYLPKAYLEDQLKNTVGNSHLSYHYAGHQWALAIDAATPVASYRHDLLKKNGTDVPKSWDEVLQLAKAGKVAVPAIPIDILMNFYMFCVALGEEPFVGKQEVVSNDIGTQALEQMRHLYSIVDRVMFGFNPIGVAEAMSKTDAYWYCPFAYGYSNYSRNGYAKHVLTYTDLPLFNKTTLLRSTLGGTGLAVSVHCQQKELAVEFARTVVSAECQSTLYVEHGGQPGHRSAWTDPRVNVNTNNYFQNTLPTLDRAYVRPRYNGYLEFQDHAGDPIQKFFLDGGDPHAVLRSINAMYVKSQKHPQAAVKDYAND